MTTTRSFVVVLTDNDGANRAKCRDQIRVEFPDCHELNETAFLVSGTRMLTDEVARRIGMKGDRRECAGVVFRIGMYFAGYTDTDTWDWLARTEGRNE